MNELERRIEAAEKEEDYIPSKGPSKKTIIISLVGVALSLALLFTLRPLEKEPIDEPITEPTYPYIPGVVWLSPDEVGLVYNPGEPVSWAMRIYNGNDFEIPVSIIVHSLEYTYYDCIEEGWISFSEKDFILGPKESKDIECILRIKGPYVIYQFGIGAKVNTSNPIDVVSLSKVTLTQIGGEENG